MKEMCVDDLDLVAGGLNLSGNRISENVIDLRGIDMGPFGIDANGVCWRPGTPSITMYPNSADESGTDYAGTEYAN